MPQHLLTCIVSCFFSADIESEDEINPHQDTPERGNSDQDTSLEGNSHHRLSESNSVSVFDAFLSAIDLTF